jgi:hypothetical protein
MKIDWQTAYIPGYQGQAEIVRRIHESPSQKLCVILPGRNFAPDKSALDLIGQMALQHGWDLLSLRYSFQVSPYAADAMKLDDLLVEAQGILPFLAGYQEVCLVGKSLGSSLARRLIDQVEAPERSLLLVTPLPDSFAGAAPCPRLCLIGTADPVFPESTAAREARPAEWRCYEGADHGLYVPGDWRATASLWQRLTADAEAFLTRNLPQGCSPHWPTT